MNCSQKASLIACLAVLSLQTVQAADTPPPGQTNTNGPTMLPPVTVTETNQQEALSSPSLSDAARQKSEVPGGFTLRDNTRFNQGRGANFMDLLGGVPGLTLQSENGMEISKVSVRGSGILSEDEPLGIIFLLDGFPFNQGDGETIMEDFSLGSIKYAEVFRGANAFKYGAITLGGAINLVSKTGYDTGPFETRIEGGSYGFVRAFAASGGVEGPFDYYAALTGRTREGFREHSSEYTGDLFANFGYRITDNLENRLYFSVTRTDRLIPGGITKEQMQQDPTQIDPINSDQDTDKKWYYIRIADKVSFKTDNEEASVGGYWWHRDLYERDIFTQDDDADGIQGYFSDNFGFMLNSVTRGELFGRRNILTAGFTPTLEREVDTDWENFHGQKGIQDGRDAELSINAPLFAEDQQYITEKFSVLAGIQAIYIQRNLTDYPVQTPTYVNQSTDLAFRTLNPKVGAIYEFDPETQIYANFSRSFQPPSFDNMLDLDFGKTNGLPPFLQFTPLVPQRAWTAEVGTRGEAGRFGWELSLYRSWVRNELLDINNNLGEDRGAVNIPKTYHQGIEAGLEIELLNDVLFKKSTNAAGDSIRLEQSYTLNDFHFQDDPVYGDNRIAGVPIHFYQAQLMYTGPHGIYFGPNISWNITRFPVDHANTLYADGYALVGFKAGVTLCKGISVFFDARNLADTRYPGAVDPIPDARTVGGPAEVFHPGDGRSFYGGVSWTW